MILSIDGHVIPVHPVVASIIALCLDNHDTIWKQGYGCLFIDYAPDEVRVRLLKKSPIRQEIKKTLDRDRPIAV